MKFLSGMKFFQISKSQKKIFQNTILSLKFKFQAQDSFLDFFFFFFEIWRSEKQIALSEKKPSLIQANSIVLTSYSLNEAPPGF